MAAEAYSFEELAEAGWSEADLEWEQAASAAMDTLAANDLASALEETARGLRIANENFTRDDPRLGASLANQGVGLIASGQENLSGRALGDAVTVWKSCDPWIAKMTAPRVARSSLFHMRMEQLHRPTYEARWRLKWAELVEEARARIGDGKAVAILSRDEAIEQAARWRRERPAMLNDTRKLMAAVILLLSRPA